MTYEDVYEDLIGIGLGRGIRPDVPLDAENFTRSLVREYSGQREEFGDWYAARLDEHYRSFAEPPAWIQDPEWQFDQGRPMTFVGQIEQAVAGAHSLAFFVFWNPKTGNTKVVVQSD